MCLWWGIEHQETCPHSCALAALCPSHDQVSPHCPTGASSGPVPKLPVWISLIINLGASAPGLEFVGSPGTSQLYLPHSGSVLSTCMGSGRQFCNPGWEAAHGRGTGIREWAQIHGSRLCPHLPTTVSLTKFTFSTPLLLRGGCLSEAHCLS